ncbi:PREDICTED: vegetative cell wall protein gp1-like [Chinchilla lanigera]|uniref:vegetative cell wall protein gp1-like n=1 Tax=Chinchilla lanigera TaxID=34839 RepID=UPI00038F07A6|nr:PREDICTED: vegetative cell wall protein gp1-like [Chinchilla lanigera]XP_005411823.1 PREDICTED: vegetative cell wall protein gp1-like [Chinchilla lanigera]
MLHHSGGGREAGAAMSLSPGRGDSTLHVAALGSGLQRRKSAAPQRAMPAGAGSSESTGLGRELQAAGGGRNSPRPPAAPRCLRQRSLSRPPSGRATARPPLPAREEMRPLAPPTAACRPPLWASSDPSRPAHTRPRPHHALPPPGASHTRPRTVGSPPSAARLCAPQAPAHCTRFYLLPSGPAHLQPPSPAQPHRPRPPHTPCARHR